MSLWITRCALLTAHGEGAGALASEAPWATFGGQRAALWPGVASEECPGVSLKVEQRDRACAHALLVAHRLLDGAGELGEAGDVGLVLGTALGCGSVNDAYHRGLVQQGNSRASPVLFGYTVPSAPVGEVAVAFGLRGHQLVVMAGRCSGLAALAEARRALLLGRASALVVLASDALSPDRAVLLGEQGEPPSIEATAALLIEREDHARSRGRSPLARLRGATLLPGPAAGQAPAGASYLGASGVVELVAWLGDPRGVIEVSASDHGQVAVATAEAA